MARLGRSVPIQARVLHSPVIATGAQVFNGDLQLTGSGTLALSATTLTVSGPVVLSGSGTLASTATITASGSLTLAGSGTLTPAQSSLTAAGSVTLSGSGALALSALTPGIGEFALNLVTNPSFEVDLTGWSNTGVGTFSRTVTGPSSGSFAVRHVNGGPTAVLESDFMAVAVGEPYTLSAYLKSTTAGSSVSMLLNWYDASSVSLGTTSSVATSGTTVARYSLTATAPASAAKAKARITGQATSAQTSTVDAVMLTAGSTLYDYFDGDTADDATYAYDWTGTAHASTSTRRGGVPVSLSGSGTLTLTAFTPSPTQSLTLSGSGTLALSSFTPSPVQSLALTGSGTLALSSFVPALIQSLALSGDGALTLSATTLTASGSLALSGDGALAPTGTLAVPGALALSGDGTLTLTQAALVVSGILTLAGSGALAPVQTALTVPGTLTLSGSGALAGARLFPGTASDYGSSASGSGWADPANAEGADDSAYATWVSAGSSAVSNPLQVGGFGAHSSIPGDATQIVVHVRVKGYVSHV